MVVVEDILADGVLEVELVLLAVAHLGEVEALELVTTGLLMEEEEAVALEALNVPMVVTAVKAKNMVQMLIMQVALQILVLLTMESQPVTGEVEMPVPTVKMDGYISLSLKKQKANLKSMAM
jgi:hypothetical protein